MFRNSSSFSDIETEAMRGGQGRSWLSVILLSCAIQLSAQEISVKGGFLEDSLLIGEDIHFWIAASYPPDLEMVFPDSGYTFTPFEYSDKSYFPTTIKDGLAYDSTIYAIQSFEIDPVQYLQLSTIVLSGTDSLLIKTAVDSVFLTELAPFVSDTTQLKTNLDYQVVGTAFNYPLMYYILGGLIVLILILLLIFGKDIARWFKLRKLRIQYEQFRELFSAYITKLKVDPSPELAEKTLIAWKSYLERFDKVPYSVMTSKEILSLSQAAELEQPLKSIDRVVYGKRVQENIYQDFQQIEEYVEDRYSKKVVEIKDGK